MRTNQLGILFFLILFAAPVLEGATPLTTELVATGFDKPLFVTAPPGDFHRIFVVQQLGKILVVKDGVVLATPFIDLSAKVSQSGNERGLLGMAFHPDYGTNGLFYVSYTRSSDGASMVERFAVSAADPDVANPVLNLSILGPVTQPFSNHNGGCIQFGWDGKLYLGLGDGGSAGDPGCRAQNGLTLLGKILRLNDDGTIPADNPFVGDANFLDEIWALGVRNPWRFSFDWGTGDLYIADVGQSAKEEIDFQAAASFGGENYGWKVMEGTDCYSTTACPPTVTPCNDTSLILPIHEYTHSGGKCSITGGYVYRGCAIPDLVGTYFFADFCSGQIWSFRYDGATMTDFTDRTAELAPGGGLSIASITSFGEDGDGEIYIVDRGTTTTNGEVFKIVPNGPAPYVDLGFSKPGTDNVAPELDICGLLGSGDSAHLRLRNAYPLSIAILVYSGFMNPFPVFGGTLIPDLALGQYKVINTDAAGEYMLSLSGGGGPKDIYVQVLVSDPGATQDVSFSNAIKATKQP